MVNFDLYQFVYGTKPKRKRSSLKYTAFPHERVIYISSKDGNLVGKFRGMPAYPSRECALKPGLILVNYISAMRDNVGVIVSGVNISFELLSDYAVSILESDSVKIKVAEHSGSKFSFFMRNGIPNAFIRQGSKLSVVEIPRQFEFVEVGRLKSLRAEPSLSL